jgi:hypothetical protein
MNLALLLTHAAATLFMVGLIWFVQVVHYPLAGRVGEGTFAAYQQAHMARTAWVVGPPMLAELATTAVLLVHRPAGIPTWVPWAGAALLAVVWGATAVFQVPLHTALTGGLDPERVARLVATNWIRTAGWTLRGALALGCIAWAWEAR